MVSMGFEKESQPRKGGISEEDRMLSSERAAPERRRREAPTEIVADRTVQEKNRTSEQTACGSGEV
jgi:hypothetical protein